MWRCVASQNRNGTMGKSDDRRRQEAAKRQARKDLRRDDEAKKAHQRTVQKQREIRDRGKRR